MPMVRTDRREIGEVFEFKGVKLTVMPSLRGFGCCNNCYGNHVADGCIQLGRCGEIVFVADENIDRHTADLVANKLVNEK